MSYQIVIVQGHVGSKPEVKHTPSGDAVANFSVAVSEKWKDKKTGEDRETTEWVNCVAWRRLGEVCGEYLDKGSNVLVEGVMKTDSWEKDGVKHQRTKIQLSKMKMLGGKGDGAQAANMQQQRAEQEKNNPSANKTAVAPEGAEFDDDIPF